jgi:hypothetical protein
MESATSEQLNMAAKISTHRKIDFEVALELVLTDPVAAENATFFNRPIPLRRQTEGGLTTADAKELLAEAYSRGRADADQDAKIIALEHKIVELETQQVQSNQLARIAGIGIVDHIEDHYLNDSESSQLSPLQTLNFMMEALPVSMHRGFIKNLPPDLRSLLENQEKAKALTSSESEFDVSDGDEPEEETLPVPTKRRSFFGLG